jgi:CheY-like chemotaxis protein
MPCRLLYIEDNPADARMLREALQDAQPPVDVTVMDDGDQAIAALRSGAPIPDLIMLDLSLQRTEGTEILAEFKSDPVLKSIPVIVISAAPALLRSCQQLYAMSANCCVQKPVSLDEIIRVVRAIHEFWFTVAFLPPRTRSAAP